MHFGEESPYRDDELKDLLELLADEFNARNSRPPNAFEIELELDRWLERVKRFSPLFL